MIMIIIKFVISVVGGQGDYWPRAPKGVTTPLVIKRRLHIPDVRVVDSLLHPTKLVLGQ